MSDLEKALKEQKKTTKIKKIYGILGIPLGGQRIVEVPSREGYVYVRLRDNQSELIQALNSEVSPVYDLPVVLVREGNKYKIEGRDTERYQNWGSFSSFIPRHGDQHSFNEGVGGGGDIVWVNGKQFMPMLVMPSGSLGANNVIVNEYRIQDGATGWIFSGGTGTPNLLGYKPLNANAVMILVYVDQTTGNPGFIVGSGSYFANTITGSAQVNQYIPANPSSDYLPAMAVRLTSGTAVIGWDNLYDVRQYYGGSGGSASTGSSSGLPLFITGSVPYAGSNGILKEDNPKFSFDETFDTLWIGKKYTPAITLDDFRLFLRATGTNVAAAMGIITAGTGTSGGASPTYNGYKSRGTFDVPTPVGAGDALLTIIGAGYDGTAYQNASRIRLYANTNFITGSNYETRMDFEVTPSGSATRIPKMSLYGDNLNLINTGTYNVNGTPHQHLSYIPLPMHGLNGTGAAGSTNYLPPFLYGLNVSNFNFATPRGGTVKNLTVVINSAQPGTGSLVFTVQKNNVDTAIVITVPAGGGAGAYQNTANTFTVVPTDRIIVKVVNNASGASAQIGASSLELEISTG